MTPSVKTILDRHSAAYQLHHHEEIFTGEDAKRVLDFPRDAMLKCLVFKLPDGMLTLVGINVNSRIDYKKLCTALSTPRQSLKQASEEEIREQLGMEPGGIGPFPVTQSTVVIDIAMKSSPIVFCGTGARDSTLELSMSELARITQAKFFSVTK